MPPFFYTGIQIVHDQKIKEALEDHRLSTKQATPKRSLFQIFSAFLARSVSFSAHKPETNFHGCDVEAKGTAS
jgi:hypothetical protein